MKLKRTFVVLLVSFLVVAVCPQAFGKTSVSLQQAVKEGKVEVDVTALGGATGNTIRVNVKRKVPEELHISITPGTVFIAKGAKVQNITGGTVKGEFIGSSNKYRRTSVMVLADNATHSYLVESFCLDYHKPAPKRSHSFSLALTDQRALRILKAPKDKSASVWAWQCALWMDRAGVTAEQLKRRFPKHVTNVEINVARGMLRHAEQTGIAGIPDGLATAVRVEVEGLFSSNPAVRRQAVKGLGTMGDRAAAAMPLVAVNVIDPRFGTTRVNVPAGAADPATWLEAVGLPALGSFVQGLEAGGTSVSVQTGEMLEAIRTARLERFSTRLKHTNWRVRQRAARTLGAIKDARAVEPLIGALKDEDGRVQEEAAQALSKITGEDFGKDHQKWRTWWQQNRETLLPPQ